jgi:dephospho-CoA kinase
VDRAIPVVTFLVGLTGGIGSGKTTASRHFERLGATVVDTDEISRQLTGEGGEAMAAIEAEFGREVVTQGGALDRDAMRARAFGDETVRARLESILHPRIRRTADQALAGASGPYAMVVVPLLFEKRGYRDRVDRILVIDCPDAIQVSRVAGRSALASEEIARIMAAQWPRWRRLQCADDVAWNGGEPAALQHQCERLHLEYAERARARGSQFVKVPAIGPQSRAG